ncbi:MAG TPA: RIP metalloprotease RseP [Thermodesulfovibrionales bacterium]|nr:RIP metalloprotease RseP [Thermodesulfovibrionales bacterium]
MSILSAIILLGVIIFVHEFGHFLFAKLLKVRVEKFSLGFGPKIIGKKHGETEYLISAIPLGGYVKMLGETPDNELTEEEKPFAFNTQRLWKRFAIIFAGPFFNIVFAAVIFFFSFVNGMPVLLPDVGAVMTGTPAEKAGLLKGDRIAAIDGKSVTQWDEMTDIVRSSPGKLLRLEIQRGGRTLTLSVTPEKKKMKNLFGEEKEGGLIGIQPSGDTSVKRESVPDAFRDSISKTVELSELTVVSVVKLVQRVIPMNTVGGPIMIVQMAGEQASRGALSFFIFMAIININLGIINLFPIPILDGGHILFIGIEAIRKKPLSEKAISVSQKIGLAILLSLMVVVLYNDFVRLITGRQFP